MRFFLDACKVDVLKFMEKGWEILRIHQLCEDYNLELDGSVDKTLQETNVDVNHLVVLTKQ